jgi:hypothetical protein
MCVRGSDPKSISSFKISNFTSHRFQNQILKRTEPCLDILGRVLGIRIFNSTLVSFLKTQNFKRTEEGDESGFDVLRRVFGQNECQEVEGAGPSR